MSTTPRISFDEAGAQTYRHRQRSGTLASIPPNGLPNHGHHPLEPAHQNAFENEFNDRYTHALKDEQGRDERREERPEQDGYFGETSEMDTDFDWDESDDSELDEAEKEEKRRRAERLREEDHDAHIRRAKRLRKLYLSFMKLARPIRTGILLLIGSGLCITPAIIVWTRFPNTSVRPHVLAWSIWASVACAAACLTSIVVDIMPAIFIKLVLVFYGSTPEALKTQVELWMGVKFWTKLALGLTWDWVAFVVIVNDFFGGERNGSLSYFTWVIKANAALFASGVILLIEKVLLQIIKLGFHRTSLAGRLEENARALWALDKLAAAKEIRRTPRQRRGMFGAFTSSRMGSRAGSRRPSLEGTPPTTEKSRSGGRSTPRPRAEEPVVINMPEVPQPAPTKLGTGLWRRRSRTQADLQAEAEKQNGGVPAESLMRELHKAKNNQQSASSSPEQHRHSRSHSHHGSPSHQKRPSASRFSSNFNPKEFADHLTHALGKAAFKRGLGTERSAVGSTHSAKKLARKLFEGLDEDQGGVITKDEFEPFFKNKKDAEVAFAIFDKDGNGDIDRKEMRNAVSRIYRERTALVTSLKDMSSAVGKLDAVLLSVAFLIILFVWLFIFNPDGTTAQLVPIATVVLGFSFVFGTSAKNLFESMLFIFSIHPYDVGDLVFIDDQPLVVQAFGLFSTTFKRVDGQVMIAPNSLLGASKYILNVRRSGPMWETTNIQLGFDTPFSVIQDFRTRLRQYVSDNGREWKGGLDVNVDFMQNQNLIQLIIAMEHKTNWSDWGARWDRRTKLMKEVKTILDDLNVTYRLPPQPVSFVPKGGPPPFRPGGGMRRDESNSTQSLSPARSPRRRGDVASGNAGFTGTGGGFQSFVSPAGTIPTLRVDTAQTFASGSGR